MKLERFLLRELLRWKDSEKRKPLILKGVRQCGKTWLLRRFGEQYFADTAYFNFEQDCDLAAFFESSYEPQRIIMNLSAYRRKQIQPGKTLVIFDEIQSCPRALNSLKYFCEQNPEYVIAAAGSLLGISLAAQEGFPVGKVDFLELTPCTFKEYLRAADPMLEEYVGKVPLAPIPLPFADRLAGYLREYLAFGGMPAVAATFLESHSIDEAEAVLEALQIAYEADFSRDIPARDIPKLFLIWRSIPVQFARENGRFLFNEVRKGARARELEDALQWLINAFMVMPVRQVQCPELPLRAHEDRKIFKLYPADVGLLRHLAALPPGVLLNSRDVFADFKGHFAENYVVQQFRAMGISPVCYWTSSSGRAEVDFLIQQQDSVVPVEVKSGLNLRSQSLKTYREKYAPAISLRTSMQNLRWDDGLLNLPLYLLEELPRFLAELETRAEK